MMGLYDAKLCSICKERVGLLGTKTIKNGILCQGCALKFRNVPNIERLSSEEILIEECNIDNNISICPNCNAKMVNGVCPYCGTRK